MFWWDIFFDVGYMQPICQSQNFRQCYYISTYHSQLPQVSFSKRLRIPRRSLSSEASNLIQEVWRIAKDEIMTPFAIMRLWHYLLSKWFSFKARINCWVNLLKYPSFFLSIEGSTSSSYFWKMRGILILERWLSTSKWVFYGLHCCKIAVSWQLFLLWILNCGTLAGSKIWRWMHIQSRSRNILCVVRKEIEWWSAPCNTQGFLNNLHAYI